MALRAATGQRDTTTTARVYFNIVGRWLRTAPDLSPPSMEAVSIACQAGFDIFVSNTFFWSEEFTVKAIRVHAFGGPDVLKYEDVPEPTPKQGEALVKIEAAGVNFIDIYQRTGVYKVPLPLTLGHEGAGTVAAVGAGVRRRQGRRPGRVDERPRQLRADDSPSRPIVWSRCRPASRPSRAPR